MKFDVLAVGDLNIDLILGLTSLPEFGREVLAHSIAQHAGGVAANFATYCVRLGLDVALVARVGRDSYGDFLIDHMREVGVCTEYIIRDDTLATGLTVSLSGPADRAFVTHLGTIDSLTGADVPDALLAQARFVHVGSYFMQSKLQPDLPDLLQRAHAAGALTSLDTGYDPYERWNTALPQALPHLDLFLPNEIEATAIADDPDALSAGRGLAAATAAVALKLGGKGSWLLTKEDELFAPPFAVEVVDTTCCGDSFDAGFVAAWLKGKAPQERLLWGNACGALVASGPGNYAENVSVESIEKVISTGRAMPKTG
jgi:sugar/nucleoside kinase (ribokinase family)